MNVQVVQGDLLDQPVEVIVNAWNRNVLASRSARLPLTALKRKGPRIVRSRERLITPLQISDQSP